MKDQTVSTKISQEDMDKLEKIAKRDDVYISQLIRRAIKKYLEGVNGTDKKSRS